MREAAAGSVAKERPPGWDQAVAAAGAFLQSGQKAGGTPFTVTDSEGGTLTATWDGAKYVQVEGLGFKTNFLSNGGSWASAKGVLLANSTHGSNGKKLVDHFLPEDPQDTPETQQPEQPEQAGGKVVRRIPQVIPGQSTQLKFKKYPKIAKQMKDIDGAVTKRFTDFIKSNEFKELSPKTQERMGRPDGMEWGRGWFTGGATKSLEDKASGAHGITIVDGEIKIIEEGEEGYEPTETLKRNTLTSLKDVFETLDKDKLDAGDCDDLQSKVWIGSQKIGIRANAQDPTQGLLISDNQNIAGAFLKFRARELGCEIPKFKSAENDSAFRGFSVEKISPAINLWRRCKQRNAEKEGMEFPDDAASKEYDRISKRFCDVSKDLMQEFGKEFREKLVKVHKKWIGDGHVAVRLEDSSTYDDLKTLLDEEGGVEVLRSLIDISHDSVETRSPDFIVVVGGKTGLRYKDDTAEGWLPDEYGNCDNANNAMRSVGDYYDKWEAIKIPAAEFFAKDSEQFGLAKEMDDNIGKEGAMICIGGTSLKNYLSVRDKNPKLGENFLSRVGRAFDCMVGKKNKSGNRCEGEEDIDSLKEFLNKVPKKLGITNIKKFWKDVQGYDQEFRDIEASVAALDMDQVVFDKDDGIVTGVKTSSLGTITNALEDALKKNNTYDDQGNRETLVGEALMKIKELDLKDEDGQISARQIILSHLSNSKNNKDLQKEQDERDAYTGDGDPPIGRATKHLLATSWTISASENDMSIFDTRSLGLKKKGKSYVQEIRETHSAYQNDYLYAIIGGIKNNTWKVSSKGATVSISSEKDPEISFKRGIQNRSTNAGTRGGQQVECSVTPKMLVSVNPDGHHATPPSQPGTENNSIQTFLDNQKVLLEELLAAMK